MKLIFFGTSEFAVPSLAALLQSRHEVLAVVTQPDRRMGRHLRISPPQVKVLAEERAPLQILAGRELSVLQPEELDGAFIESLRKFGADLFVAAAYGKILPKELLEIPKIFSVNVHGSLLPKYRGAAPVNWALINGEETTGVTIIKMNEKLDEGEIISKKEAKIEEDDDAVTLGERLSKLGAELLLEAIELIEKNEFALSPQEGEASYAPKLNKEDGMIRWDLPAVAIERRIRGLIPWPGSYTHFEGKVIKVHRAKISNETTKNPGKEGAPSVDACGAIVEISKEKGIVVQTGLGLLSLTELQLEGGKRLAAHAFLAGHRLCIGGKFLCNTQ